VTWGKGRVAVLAKQGDVCNYNEQNPGAKEQNIAICFSHLWGKPMRLRGVGDFLSGKKKWENETCGTLKLLNGAKLEDLENA
jgi:hypothetical protein